MSDRREINKAIANHGYWKVRLNDAIETGNSEWSPEKVRQDDLCNFGKWFYALSPEEKASEFWKKVQPLHAQFHREAAKVLKLALDGHKDEAFALTTDMRGDFLRLSMELTNALHAWMMACPEENP